jgi:hypothetical protein
MLVNIQSFELSDPTVNSQMIALAASGADVLIIAATQKQTVQALHKAHELDWHSHFRRVVRQTRHRPWKMRRVVPARNTALQKQLRDLVVIQIFLDGKIWCGADRRIVEDMDDLTTLAIM